VIDVDKMEVDKVDIRGSAPVFNTKELLREIYDDMKILRPQVTSLVDANLPARVLALEVTSARLVEKDLAEKQLDVERELRYQQGSTAAKEAVAAALAALDKQSTLEGTFLDRRLNKTEPLGDTLARLSGGSAAVQQGWKYVLAVGTLVIGFAALLIAFSQ
jgi:hypothetical protein